MRLRRFGIAVLAASMLATSAAGAASGESLVAAGDIAKSSRRRAR
jgi:hypothetical protein